MGKPFFRQQVVGFNGSRYIFTMNTHRYPHKQVLRPLHNFTINLHQVRTFQCFKTEVVVAEITIVKNGFVQFGCMFMDHFPGVFGNEWSVLPGFRIHIRVKPLHGVRERLTGNLVQVRNSNAGR